jgi:pSer/pThr/pTyr-binding forkhead associated (FHA) protein
MVQLKILSGKKAGTDWVARRFPVRIGRAPTMDLQLEEDGIWDQHLILTFEPQSGVSVSTEEQALARVNGEPAAQTPLRNGDLIELGPVKLQFWLSDTRQGSLRLREALTWTGIVAITLAQFALILLLR